MTIENNITLGFLRLPFAGSSCWWYYVDKGVCICNITKVKDLLDVDNMRRIEF